MVFSSSIFLFIFLPIAILGYFLLHPRYRNPFLLIASLLFYAWGEPKFVLIMLLSIVINWMTAWAISKMEKHTGLRKVVLIFAVAMNLLILFVFKYLNFAVANINKIVNVLPQTNITLPIGISFFTFQGLSYVVDVYRKKVSVQKNLLNVGLYISFFPQLIAGPIVRYETIAAEIVDRTTTWDDFCIGVERFLRGLFKKVILANNLALLADSAFGRTGEQLTVLMAWMGALAYTFQIFFDFSGYSEMAIGLGRIFGFHFDENFNYPYISKSVTEFWRRWHMSLGTWFRDYVYFPLGGSRVATVKRHIFNLFVVWLLTGIWHGAGWNFIAWGMLSFVMLVLEKFVVHPEKFKKNIGLTSVWRVVTLLIIVFGWVLFRSTTLQGGMDYYRSMFGIGVSFTDVDTWVSLKENYVVLVIACLCSTPVFKCLKEKVDQTKLAVSADILKVVVYLALLAFSVSYLVMGAHNPFIYFNF